VSYSQLVVFRDGKAEGDKEYPNGHGTAPVVWFGLIRKYREALFPGADFDGPDKYRYKAPAAWNDLFKRWESLPMENWEQVAFLWSCDWSVTKRKNFGDLAKALWRFEEEHREPGCVCHLKAIAARLEDLSTDETVEAAALYATSCGDDPWEVCEYNEEEDEHDCRPYDLRRDTKHWFIFGEPEAGEEP